MAENIHPGSFVGDSVEEFKKLPTWGKALAVGVLALVAFLAWRAHSSSSSAQQAASNSLGYTGSSGAATAGTQSPFPMVGNLPVLPNNVNPLFDSSGNPIAYQQNPTTPTVPSSPTTPKNPSVPPANPPTHTNNNSSGNPLVPYGTSVPSKAGSKYSYAGTQYTIVPGAGGRIWGKTSSGQQVLLTAPKSYYHGSGGQSEGTGSGGFSMFAFMSDPLVYLVSAHPHTPSTVG